MIDLYTAGTPISSVRITLACARGGVTLNSVPVQVTFARSHPDVLVVQLKPSPAKTRAAALG